MKQYRILDLDNCISDDRARIQFIRWDAPIHWEKYDTYHRLSHQDAVGNRHLFDRVQDKILIFTARPEAYRGVTEQWLQRHCVPHEALFMRPNDDMRPSAPVKESLLLHAVQMGLSLKRVALAADDHPQVLAMYRKYGLWAELWFLHHVSAYRGTEAA